MKKAHQNNCKVNIFRKDSRKPRHVDEKVTEVKIDDITDLSLNFINNLAHYYKSRMLFTDYLFHLNTLNRK